MACPSPSYVALWTANSSCCPKKHVILSWFFSKASGEIWQNSKTNPRIQFMLHLDQHLLTPRNFWKQTIGPSGSFQVSELHRSVWWRIFCWWTVYCEVLELYCFIYLSYCIKLGLKQRTQTPEIRKIRKIRNLSTTTKHTDHSCKPGNKQPGNGLAERRNALPDFHVEKFQPFHGMIRVFWSFVPGRRKLRPKWSHWKSFRPTSRSFGFEWLFGKDSIVSHDGCPWDWYICLHWMVDFYGKCRHSTNIPHMDPMGFRKGLVHQQFQQNHLTIQQDPLHQSLNLLLVVFVACWNLTKNGKMMDDGCLFHMSEVPEFCIFFWQEWSSQGISKCFGEAS